jgi:hypothetical protein
LPTELLGALLVAGGMLALILFSRRSAPALG